MELNDFIKNFAAQFDETEESLFTADTRFRELPEWSSLTALSIIAMVDAEYNVKVKGDDFRDFSTISDLFNIIKSRK